MGAIAHNALIVAAAAALDLLLGDPRRLPHPVVGIGRLITFLEGRLRRHIVSERGGGVILLCLTVAITAVLTFLVLKGASSLSPLAGNLAAVTIAWTCLAARSLHRESALVIDALQRGDMGEARRFLSRIVGRDTSHLTEPEIIRAVVETVAENTSDGIIAPMFYLALGGPALGMAYKAVNTLDSMVGYKNDRYLRFGWASARFDDLANHIPARVTGLLMVLLAPPAGLSGRNAWHIMRRDGRNHTSPNSGIPEAAAAGALGVQLGGLNRYFGVDVEKPTIGDAASPLSVASYAGVIRLMYGAELLFLAGLLLLGWNVA